jgi:hypothetical protein
MSRIKKGIEKAGHEVKADSEYAGHEVKADSEYGYGSGKGRSLRRDSIAELENERDEYGYGTGKG